MRFLFVHQNFPGQFLHIVRHLVAAQSHEIVFLTEANANAIPGVRKFAYRKPDPPGTDTHRVAREFEMAARRAEIVARAGYGLKQLGFAPDIIIGHHGWGELLNIRDVWPDAPLLGYFEFYYHTDGADVGFDPEFPANPADFARIRAKNATNLLALQLGGHGQTPTQWQLSTYPEWARPSISLLREGVDLDRCRPDLSARKVSIKIGEMDVRPADKLVTYVARDLEPYRGFHLMMRALPPLLRARKDIRVVMVGGDGVSYGATPAEGTWRQIMMRQLNGAIDDSRVCFPGKIDYRTYRRMLKRSDAHVYLTYPFVASWSLREALATGCAVVGSDTAPVREFITDGENGLLASFDPKGLANRVLAVIEDRDLASRLRQNARRYAQTHLAMDY
ncbi:MAG: glycosyltransferase family 4 protein, partial [Acetobacteraceae bacterium]|nr:glycosyltransferase family 4 protein [Acetobacteraceae bacterium]